LGDRQDTEHNVGEGLCQGDGGIEVSYWEVVFAGLDGGLLCVG